MNGLIWDVTAMNRYNNDMMVGDLVLERHYRHKVTHYFNSVECLPDEFKNAEVIASSVYDRGTNCAVEYMGGILIYNYSSQGNGLNLLGFYPSQEKADEVLKHAKSIVKTITQTDNKVTVIFSNVAHNGGIVNNAKRLEAPKFDDIRINYNKDLQAKLDELMNISHESLAGCGRIMLWRGMPGAGKTFCIRALCQAWKNWCNFYYIIDPESFFGQADYMMGLISRMSDEESDDDDIFGGIGGIVSGSSIPEIKPSDRWNLLLLEDCGELIAKDAKESTGQSLARLLNLSDGLLGQGVKLLILVTTNEDIESLNDAIKRQGRCLANIAFNPFNKSEAAEWLAHHGYNGNVPEKIALSDLYALVNDHKTITNQSSQKIGF